MLIYKTDGTIEHVHLKSPVTLDQLQAAVDGYIEAVPHTKSRAYCNEEGLLRSMPFNVKASERFGLRLYGNVVELEKGDKQ